MPAQKVLIAETDAKAAARMAQGLQQRGYEIVTATDASHALSAARAAQPEVIVMNGQLAGGGGIVALKRIRSNVYTTNIPVLMLVKTDREAREALNVGAQECLPPAPEAEPLHAAIQKHLLEELDFTQAPREVLEAPARVEALRDTGLLDTPPEEAFDRLTRLAQRLVGAPTALVSLVDKDRQFFKSQVGLAEPYASARQTELSHSFCQWVVSGREPLVVDDAAEHPVLRSNLAVKYMKVNAYAGIPILGKSGEAIGSFCAIDSTARRWTGEELDTLKDLAQVTEAYARLARARQEGDGAPMHNLAVSADVAGKAIQGITRILRRFGNRLDAQERDELLQVIEEQSGHLAASVAGE
jgi:CheY-like chemotaxis protein